MKTFNQFINESVELSESLGSASAATETFARTHSKDYNPKEEDSHYKPDNDSHHHSFTAPKKSGDLHKALIDHFKSKGFQVKKVSSHDAAHSAEGTYEGTTKRYELHKDGKVFHAHHDVTEFDNHHNFHNVEISRNPHETISKRKNTPTFGNFLAGDHPAAKELRDTVKSHMANPESPIGKKKH